MNNRNNFPISNTQQALKGGLRILLALVACYLLAPVILAIAGAFLTAFLVVLALSTIRFITTPYPWSTQKWMFTDVDNWVPIWPILSFLGSLGYYVFLLVEKGFIRNYYEFIF